MELTKELEQINKELSKFNIEFFIKDSALRTDKIDVRYCDGNQLEHEDNQNPFRWKDIVVEANNDNKILNRAAELLMINNERLFNQLNSVFIVNPTKKDLPETCRSCSEKLTDEVGFKGRFPSFNSSSEWFYSEDNNKGWAMRLELKTPFLGYNPFSSLKNPYQSMLEATELPTNRICEIMCPKCHEEHNERMEELMKDL